MKPNRNKPDEVSTGSNGNIKYTKIYKIKVLDCRTHRTQGKS